MFLAQVCGQGYGPDTMYVVHVPGADMWDEGLAGVVESRQTAWGTWSRVGGWAGQNPAFVFEMRNQETLVAPTINQREILSNLYNTPRSDTLWRQVRPRIANVLRSPCCDLPDFCKYKYAMMV